MAVETNVLMFRWEKRDAKTQKSNNMMLSTDASLRSHIQAEVQCDYFTYSDVL